MTLSSSWKYSISQHVLFDFPLIWIVCSGPRSMLCIHISNCDWKSRWYIYRRIHRGNYRMNIVNRHIWSPCRLREEYISWCDHQYDAISHGLWMISLQLIRIGQLDLNESIVWWRKHPKMNEFSPTNSFEMQWYLHKSLFSFSPIYYWSESLQSKFELCQIYPYQNLRWRYCEKSVQSPLDARR